MYDNHGYVKLGTIPPAGWVSPWSKVTVLENTSILVQGFAFLIRQQFDDRNHFLSLKLIRKANPCTTMLVVA